MRRCCSLFYQTKDGFFSKFVKNVKKRVNTAFIFLVYTNNRIPKTNTMVSDMTASLEKLKKLQANESKDIRTTNNLVLEKCQKIEDNAYEGINKHQPTDNEAGKLFKQQLEAYDAAILALYQKRPKRKENELLVKAAVGNRNNILAHLASQASPECTKKMTEVLRSETVIINDPLNPTPRAKLQEEMKETPKGNTSFWSKLKAGTKLFLGAAGVVAGAILIASGAAHLPTGILLMAIGAKLAYEGFRVCRGAMSDIKNMSKNEQPAKTTPPLRSFPNNTAAVPFKTILETAKRDPIEKADAAGKHEGGHKPP